MRAHTLVTAILPVVALLAACETTGDPRQGGLFGWSEAKARQRQADRRTELAAVQAQVAREESRAARLQARDRSTSRAEARAEDRLQQASARYRLRVASVRSKAALLEEESPTAATASRAHKLRAQVEAVFADPKLGEQEKAIRLGELETQIDAARQNVAR